MKATALEIIWLPPDLLTPNPWNPNKMDAFMYSRAIESIREFGFIDPITARPCRGRFEIIDGEHRWKAASDLTMPLVPVIVMEMNDARAKKLTIVLNELRGTADPASMGELLRELLLSEDMETLTRTVPFTSEAIAGMTGMKDIDWSTLDPKPKPKTEKERWVERTYRMPVDAAGVLDEAISKARDGEEMETWQALEMIAAEYLAG